MLDKFLLLLNKRIQGVPLQYLIGRVDFCGLTLAVREPILIPRPETEAMCEWTSYVFNRKLSNQNAQGECIWPIKVPFDFLSLGTSNTPTKCSSSSKSQIAPKLRILDLCSGSGCISLALASLLPQSYVVGVDLNPSAVALSNLNQQKAIQQGNISHERVQFVKGDVLNAIDLQRALSSLDFNLGTGPPFDLIISNPPYVTKLLYESSQIELKYEDKHALCIDEDESGLLFYSKIIEQANYLLKPLSELNSDRILPELIFEFGTTQQGRAIKKLLINTGFLTVQIVKDPFNRDRWIAATRKKLNEC